MPALILLVYAATALVVGPATVVVYRALGPLIAPTPLSSPDARRMPIEAWIDVSQRASGIAATFRPRILGLAAPLDTISGIVDARLPDATVLPYVAIYAFVWVFLWGGVLDAFGRGSSNSRSFAAAARAAAFPLGCLTLVALAAYLLIFMVVARLLYAAIASVGAAMTEPSVLAMRIVAYLVVGSALATCLLVVDYARIEIIIRGRASAGDAVRCAWSFVRSHPAQVAVLAVTSGGLFATLLGVYGYFEWSTRGAPRAWQAIAVGQTYIVARIILRLLTAASQVALHNRLIEPAARV
jgi:hypothetical protein